MKKILVFLSILLLPTILFANTIGHFNKNIDSLNISISAITTYFSEWFSLPNGTTFILEQTNIDDNSYQHDCYNQYVNGIRVDGCAILVHSKDSKVTNMNGEILESTHQSALSTCVNTRKQSRGDKEIILVPLIINGDSMISKYAYKIKSQQLGAYIYIDIESGDTLKKTPYVYDVQSKEMTNTIYYGRRQVTVEKNNFCFYSCTNPHIESINSTNQDITQQPYQQLINLCNTYYEPLKDSTSCYITSITYTLKSKEWCYQFNDVHPDLYITITKTNTGELVYLSNVYNDYEASSFTFNPMLLLDGTKYTIALYDEDLINDDCAGAFTIQSNIIGTGALSLDNFDVTIQTTYNPIHDAHWGMEQTLRYYKDVLHRDSYNNEGATVYQFINPFNPTSLPNNAFASTEEPYCMVYGLGDGVTMKPVVALDVMAHEFTHLVTKHNLCGGLNYEGESGAINEGLSDIFGALVENYVFGYFDWTIGEKIMVKYSNLRSMKEPKLSTDGVSPQPNTYHGDYWINTCDTGEENDYGGVHTNSGILNYWFYLLCNGGSGTNDKGDKYSVKNIDLLKATKIVYNTQCNRLINNATFQDMRDATLAEVEQYGKTSQEYKSIMNAWYAVGVGDEYAEEFELTPGNYAIVAHRDNDTDKNWYYMTAIKDGTKDRFVAVNTNKTSISDVNLEDLTAEYIWELEADGTNWKLKNGSQYITWTSNNTAKLGATGKSLTFEVAENQVQAHFNDGTAERYLSLNATTGNNYFAFYGNTGQITYLYFLPIEDTPEPPAPTNEYYIVAKRSTGNYYFFTPNKVSGKDRLIAVDAGTSVRSQIDTVNTTDDYLWTLEDAGTGKLLKSHNGTYLTCTAAKSAAMASTGIVLNMASNNDGTVTFSYAADATTTHYLSLATAGNDYFVFYGNTNQTTHLLLMPKGTNSPATDLSSLPYEGKDGIGSVKFIHNGQLLIERNGILYNAHGARVK